MGNSVEKSLFYQFVKVRGYKINRSEYAPDSFKYKSTVTLAPLFNTNKISREKMELKKTAPNL